MFHWEIKNVEYNDTSDPSLVPGTLGQRKAEITVNGRYPGGDGAITEPGPRMRHVCTTIGDIGSEGLSCIVKKGSITVL